MKSIIAALLAVTTVTAYANNSTVTVDAIEGGGYTASYFNNPVQTTPEIHVIGVYEAYTNTSPRNHALGTAVIDVLGTSNVPVDLVLSSYEPTHWVLQGDGLQYVNSVLINGYYSGSLSGIAASLIINKTGIDNWLGAYAYAWPSTSGGSDTKTLVNYIEATYGAPISTFSGAYGATKFTITLTPVPEPSGLALFTLGLIGAALLSKNKHLQRRKTAYGNKM